MKDYKKSIHELEDLLLAGVSPYHAIEKSISRLEDKGFKELKAAKAWVFCRLQCKKRRLRPENPHGRVPY